MGAATRTSQLLLSRNGVRAPYMVHAEQRPQPPPFIRTSKKYSQHNKYRRRCPNGSAAYRCHHCAVGCECACWANGTGLEKKRACEVCLPRTSSGSGHSSPSCVFQKMLPGLLQLRWARFTKSALSRPSPPSPPRCCGFLRGLLSDFRIALRRPSALFLGCLRLLRWIHWRGRLLLRLRFDWVLQNTEHA